MSEVRPLLAEATQRLSAAGIGAARVDAELLLAALLDAPRGQLLTRDQVPNSVAAEYDAWVTRRVAREPLQYITGRAPFRNLDLAVGPGVFIPRPETELLVDAVLPELTDRAEQIVIDLCAGSGALALAIADEVPAARVVAVEQSFAATRWLERNAAGSTVRVVTGDIRDPELLRPLYERADVVVSNPPYVPTPTEVEPEVLADPTDAVFAGPDGLDLLPVVITRAALLLRPGGVLAVEHDDTHGSVVPDILTRDGRFAEIADHPDLTGRARFATARRFNPHS